MKIFQTTFDESFSQNIDSISIGNEGSVIDKKAADSIVIGSGLSYVPSFCGKDKVLKNINSPIVFYEEESTNVIVSGNATLFDVYKVLIKHKRMLPVQPGCSKITIGGCIASDVHGKNYSKFGSFCNHVNSIELYHPNYGYRLINDKDEIVFKLTCGGYGLTGNICKASLKTIEINSENVITERIVFKKIDELIDYAYENLDKYDFLYSWNSTLHNKKQKNVLFASINDKRKEKNKKLVIRGKDKNKAIEKRYIGFNKLIVSFISIVMITAARCRPIKRDNLYKNLFPLDDKNFYWTLALKNGFSEIQILIPRIKFNIVHAEIKRILMQENILVSLESLKFFGENFKDRSISFNGAGICYTIHLVKPFKSNVYDDILKVMINYDCKPNLYKSTEMALRFSKLCPEYFSQFSSDMNIYDRQRFFKSIFSKMLGL